MANNCFYELKVVSPRKENLERLIKIMNYRDAEYFIYRCFNADADNEISEENGLYYVLISGDTAWSCDKWFSQEEDTNNLLIDRYEKDADGNDLHDKPIYGTAHYITLDLLCEKLDMAVEIYAEECGVGFQQHIICNKNGDCICYESEDWSQEWFDENDNQLDEPIEEGGFDYYGEFDDAKALYKEYANYEEPKQ